MLSGKPERIVCQNFKVLYMSTLRKNGLEFVGMSSVGPSITIITDKNRSEMEKIIQSTGLKIAIETKIDNAGLRISS